MFGVGWGMLRTLCEIFLNVGGENQTHLGIRGGMLLLCALCGTVGEKQIRECLRGKNFLR